jgi:hypothetical protein
MKTFTEKNVNTEKFKLNCWGYFLPSYLLPYNTKMKFLDNANKIIGKYMSFDNILTHLLQYERLRKILFSKEQLILIDNLPKLTLDSIEESSPINKNELINYVHFIESNKNDKINQKLLDIFK